VRLARLWAAGTGSAVLLVSSAYLIARQLADPLVVTGAGEITLGSVTGFTILGATIGAALAGGIARFSRRPRATFIAVTLIALAGYAVVPFTAAESIGTALWLNLFHLVVAVPVIGMLVRWLPGDRASVET
jgi:hypothetical protein